MEPKNAEAYEKRGILRDRQQPRDYEGAISDYDESIRLDPTSHAYYNRGLAHLRQGQLDRAIDDFTAALERDPWLVEALNNRGSAYGTRGDVNRAIADFKRSIELAPQHAKAYFNLGMTYALAGDRTAALNYLEKAKGLGHPKAEKAMMGI